MASKNVMDFFDDEGIQEIHEDKNLKNDNILSEFKSTHGRIMNDHAAEYTNLLRRYIENSKTSATQKKWFKNVFFVVAMWMLLASFVLFALISVSFSIKKWEGIEITALTGLISALVGVLSLYIIIPEIIARYLFNEKEDDNMTKIVESVQKYDETIFDSMNAYSFAEAVEKRGGKKAMLELKKQAQKMKVVEELPANNPEGNKDKPAENQDGDKDEPAENQDGDKDKSE